MTCCVIHPARHAREARPGNAGRARACLGGALGIASLQASATGTATAQESLGPWIFASVALLLVAGLAGWVGLELGRRQRRANTGAQRPAPRPTGDLNGAGGATPVRPATAPGPQPAARPASATSEDDAAAFSYALSHDLRAPLRVVEGFARILKEDYGRQLDRIGNDHLDRMLGASARMNAMIDAMLALAQLSNQPLANEAVDLSKLALEVVDELRRTHPERAIEVQIAPGLQTRGDRVLLRQMLENLLGNAWKYTSATSSPRISLRERPEAVGPGLKAYELSDNGAGFDMRSADRLFGLFQRLHAQSEFPGTGLGLASVLRIVRRHGGDIRAQAEPGRGARFLFTLPG
jgi:signal transduction histidine kinase